MGVTFGQVEAALARAHHIAETKRGAFQSRIKQWQKMGFPDGVNVGRGVKVEYTAKQFFQLVFMIELLRLGLTPERAIAVVKAGWPRLQQAIAETLLCQAYNVGHLHYVMIQLDALSDLQTPSERSHEHIYIQQLTDYHVWLAYGEHWLEEPEEGEEPTSDEQLANWQAMQFNVRNHMARAISLEVDSVLARAWVGLIHAEVSPLHFFTDLREWREELRRTGHAHTPALPDHEQPAGEWGDSPDEQAAKREVYYQDPMVIGAMRDPHGLARALLGIEATPEDGEDDGERSET